MGLRITQIPQNPQGWTIMLWGYNGDGKNVADSPGDKTKSCGIPAEM